MICRLCLELAEIESSLKIFDAIAEQCNIASILEQHFWFKPEPDDGLSSVLCKICWLKVNDFHQFYVSVERAHSKLQQENEKIQLTDETQINPLDLLNAVVEIKEELMDHLWQEEAVATEKDNPLNDLEVQLDDTELSQKPKNESDTELTSNEEDEDADWKPTQSTDSDDKRRRCLKPRKITSKKISSKKSCSSMQPLTEYEQEIIKKHIAMGCDLCTFVAEDFTQMREHFREKHKDEKVYVMCCERKLKKRISLLEHAHRHENPEYFKCNVCQKVLTNAYMLRLHMSANHAPEEQLIHKCDQCDKRFSRLTYLNKHLPVHIPAHERKFICDKCPQKAFASEQLLRIHVSSKHNKAVNVCHVCAKEIRDNHVFAKHVRLHFEASGPRIKCPRADCDHWLKDEDNLKVHLRRHNDDGKPFPCTKCTKVCKNRKSLRSHINYAHSNATFACEVCQKTFKRAITLKEHMASHTGESLYKCPFCTRTFNSNANMHSHKKKMHPEEWDIWRKTKQGSSQQIIHRNSNERNYQL